MASKKNIKKNNDMKIIINDKVLNAKETNLIIDIILTQKLQLDSLNKSIRKKSNIPETIRTVDSLFTKVSEVLNV